MAKLLQLPFLARASVALLLLLCLLFDLVGVFTAYWGVLAIDYSSRPVSQEVHYLGVWLPLDQASLGHLNSHQQAAQAFAVFSIIGSILISAMFICMAFLPGRWLPVRLANRLPLGTLTATAITCLVQLLLWSLMAGLYNRWRHALEAFAAASVAAASSTTAAAGASAVQSFGILGFSFALVLMANIGQLAALPAVYAVVQLDAACAASAAAAAGVATTVANSASAGSTTMTTRIDQLAAADGNVRFHRTRPQPQPQAQPPEPTPIRVVIVESPTALPASSSASAAAATKTDIDAEVASAGDNHSVENEEMLDQLHRHTSSTRGHPAVAAAGAATEPAADEV